jgi:hypothetical protein
MKFPKVHKNFLVISPQLSVAVFTLITCAVNYGFDGSEK